MRLFFILTLSTAANAFIPQPSHANAKLSSPSSLEARRSVLPIIRRNRPSLRFPDFESLFDEIDHMMDDSVYSILGQRDKDTNIVQRDFMTIRRPLGFQVAQDDNQYKVTMHVPDVEVENLDLQLDHDGRVLRLKGEQIHEDKGMKIQSRFEKAVLLGPDIDTTKLAANMSGDTLTIVAPKIESKEVLGRPKSTKIKIHVDQHPEIEDAGKSESFGGYENNTNAANTPFSAESGKDENSSVNNEHEVMPGEKKWPVKDFPY
ncbi:hypothetical protein ACHAXS_009695 [Conticribra weissflogii]